ncbi:MAG: type III toxin-antitoxin system ToxN/AbiQ family toxin [Lachnospiraceae bacterium]|nr:type III toxin-antitoxin system ToxN/AbiQ family toxin [Lachnospiraceae bacterium]
MDGLKLYSVSDAYIEFLRNDYPNVYSNKMDTRIHTRKYIGVVISLDKYKYYVPLSSPKDTDYQVAGEKKVIKKSIVPIVRIVVKNAQGERELKGTLRISHMIPVPESELELYDAENETDNAYKDLIKSEIVFIRKNKERILANAKLLYKQKAENDVTAGYVKSALEYKALEKMCDKYIRNTEYLATLDKSIAEAEEGGFVIKNLF